MPRPHVQTRPAVPAAPTSSLTRVPEMSLAPQLLERAQREGLKLSQLPVRLWLDDTMLHNGICSANLTPQELSLEQLVSLVAQAPRSWCSCGGVVLAPQMQLLWRLHRLWQILDDTLEQPASWGDLAARVGVLRPVLAPQPYPAQLAAAEQIGPVVGQATLALWSQVRRCAAVLDQALLLRALAAPQVRVTVAAHQAPLLARWAESQELWAGRGRPDSARHRPPLFTRFDAAADRQLAAHGGPVLVDLGALTASSRATEELCAGTQAASSAATASLGEVSALVTHQPLPVVLLVACDLVEVTGSRLWGHLPRLVAHAVAAKLNLGDDAIASQDVQCRQTLQLMSQLSQMLQARQPLDDVIVLAQDAL